MLGWLSTWLQQIIAVVLLAGFIDLLLPNKAMQRYVRLVAGLIILLTILTPIIRLLHGDFSAKLDQDVEGWFQGEQTKDIRMPTLEDIQKRATDLNKQQQSSALSLTQRKLTQEMSTQIEQRTSRQVEKVDLQLEAVTKGVTAGAIIRAVTVTFSSVQRAAAADPSDSESSDKGKESAAATVQPVEEVPSVAVNVQIESDGAGTNTSGSSNEIVSASRGLADTVKQVLQDRWSVEPSIVSVVERKGDGLSEH